MSFQTYIAQNRQRLEAHDLFYIYFGVYRDQSISIYIYLILNIIIVYTFQSHIQCACVRGGLAKLNPNQYHHTQRSNNNLITHIAADCEYIFCCCFFLICWQNVYCVVGDIFADCCSTKTPTAMQILRVYASIGMCFYFVFYLISFNFE